ncbi:MAG: methyltransferase [Clostridiales bacterium]|jgi:16S rRNA (guanine1207-N2)-methyltransferase|nr:methyltransferase [Clostridiales bacterium]
MSHYFVENPDVLTRERELELEIFGEKLRFLTNNGLFSCDKIDEASLTLIKNLPPITGAFLDLGCGYGVIGIALAKKFPIALTQSDINGVALEYAQKNAKLNGVSSNVIHSDGFEKIFGAFDVITLNPPIHAGKETMFRLYEESAAHLRPGGSFFIVIQKKHGAESSVKKINEIFQTCNVIYKKKGVFVIECYNTVTSGTQTNTTRSLG